MRLSATYSLWSLVATMSILPVVRANLCFMHYQMADNDLEYFIKQDLKEYSTSPMIESQATTTWVYHDHRNFATSPAGEEVRENFSYVYAANGDPLSSDKPEGAFYITYDHTLSKLVVRKDLGEVNSDIPQTLYEFVSTALGDCRSRGSTEYFIAFGSHGAGFDGFGGDENKRRRLEGSQSNQDIVSALRRALDDFSIAKFDVVGFDACLMTAFGALDDFKSVTKYFLASEEVEPGHGWSYSGLQPNGALDTAKDVVSSFINDMQGPAHLTPKTLAIVDTSKYEAFSTAWNNLSREIKTLMAANDAEVGIAFSRARTSAYSFASVYDQADDRDKISVDMLGLLQEFQRLCPTSGTNLSTLLSQATNAYAGMFIDRQVGPGTPSSLTGMHVFFPSKARYLSADYNYDSLLFNNAVTATTSAPEWLDLLKAYYSSGIPPAGGSTVCSTSTGTPAPIGVAPTPAPIAGTPSAPTSPATPPAPTSPANSLLAGASLVGSAASGMTFSATVARSVEAVFIEYGADRTAQLSSNRRKMKRSDNVQDKEEHPRYKGRQAKRQRRLQTDEDYYYQYSGDVVGSFSASGYSGTWDGSFFAISDSSSQFSQDIYVFDSGEEFKEFPVMYFPPSNPVTSSNVLGMYTFDDALAAGGQHGFVTFSTANNANGVIKDGLTLYTISNSDGESYSEVSRSRGGQIVPVNFVNAVIEGDSFDVFIGGRDGDNILAWTTGNDFQIEIISGDNYLTQNGLQILSLEMVADVGSTGEGAFVLFEFEGDGTIVNSLTGYVPPVRPPPDGGSIGLSGVQELGSTLCVGLFMLLLTSLLW